MTDKAESGKTALYLNLTLIVLVIIYISAGGQMFRWLEEDHQNEMFTKHRQEHVQCLREKLQEDAWIRGFYHYENKTNDTEGDLIRTLLNDCPKQWVTVPGWSFSESAAFAFSIITILGFGQLSVYTSTGQLFYLVYAFIGIPFVMMVLANLGKFLGKSVAYLYNRLVSAYQSLMKRRKSAEESDTESVPAFMVLGMFTFFMVVGTIISMSIDVNIGPIRSVFITFRSVTADFAEMADPEAMGEDNSTWILMSLIFVAFGQMLLMMAVEIASVYLRKLHAVGAKLKNVASMGIWFGGKQLKIGSFVAAVCVQLDVPQEKLDALNLDKLVEVMVETNGEIPEKEEKLLPREEKYMSRCTSEEWFRGSEYCLPTPPTIPKENTTANLSTPRYWCALSVVDAKDHECVACINSDRETASSNTQADCANETLCTPHYWCALSVLETENSECAAHINSGRLICLKNLHAENADETLCSPHLLQCTSLMMEPTEADCTHQLLMDDVQVMEKHHATVIDQTDGCIFCANQLPVIHMKFCEPKPIDEYRELTFKEAHKKVAMKPRDLHTIYAREWAKRDVARLTGGKTPKKVATARESSPTPTTSSRSSSRMSNSDKLTASKTAKQIVSAREPSPSTSSRPSSRMSNSGSTMSNSKPSSPAANPKPKKPLVKK